MTGSAWGDGRSLWERKNELAAIDRALADGAAGVGALLVLLGASGVGKSALALEAQHRARDRGFQVLRARAALAEHGFAFGVVRQLFEPMLASGGIRDEMWRGADAARAVLGAELGHGGMDASFATLHGLYWLAVNLSASAPVLICVDDAGWADAPSRRYLEFVVRRLAGMRAAVVIAHRIGEPSGSGLVEELSRDPLARVVSPAALSERAVAGMLTELFGVAPERAFTTACLETTSGNPLLVSELLRALATDGVQPVAAAARRAREIGSVALAAATRTRLQRLSEAAIAVASAAAVLGEAINLEKLAPVLNLSSDEVQRSLEALALAGIMERGGRASFTHPLVAEAILATVPASERSRLHQQAVRTGTARGASPRELAPHILASPPRAHPDAARVLREAAGWAASAGAPEDAARYLARAIAETDPEGDLPQLWLELGSARLQSGDPAAIADLERATQSTSDPEVRARARGLAALAHFAAGRYSASIRILEQGIDEIAPIDSELSQRLEAQLYACLHYAEPMREHDGALTAARRLNEARRHRGTYSSTLAGRLVLCSLALEEAIGGGKAGEAIALADRAIGNADILTTEGPDAAPFYSALLALIWCDELDRATAAATIALAEARKRASLTGFVQASVFRAYAHLRAGRLLDAEADARSSLDAAPLYLPGYNVLAGSCLLGSLAAQGQLNEAAATLDQIVEPDPPSSVIFMLIETRVALKQALGDHLAATTDLERYAEMERIGREPVAWRQPMVGMAPHRSLRARSLIALGKRDAARSLADEELELAHNFGTDRAIGMALHTTALLKQQPQTQLDTLEQACQILARSQSRLDYATALTDYGGALRRTGHRRDAREPLNLAQEIARAAHADPLAQRIRQELKATGMRVSRPHATGPDTLTASELRIATMASTGMSNREIAQALFITTKTVETHLSRAYQKLSITRRGQLQTILQQPQASTTATIDARLTPTTPAPRHSN